MTRDYRPIPCQMYAELEVAIMHQIRLRLAWHTTDREARLEQVLPVNLRTREREEYLLAEDSGGHVLEIRLDRISRFTPL
jgi:Rho-binding antiterminator